MTTKISSIVAEQLLPQKGGDSEKEHQLSEIKIAPYLNKLLERASSQPSEPLGKILASNEAREYIAKFSFFQNLVLQTYTAINQTYLYTNILLNGKTKITTRGKRYHLLVQTYTANNLM